MSGLEPNYTNIIKQELEIADLQFALAQQTEKIERLEQEVEDLTGKREIQVQHNAELVERLAQQAQEIARLKGIEP